MFSLKQAIILALVGSTVASPIAHWGYNRDNKEELPGGRTKLTQGFSGQGSRDKYVVVVSSGTNQGPASPVRGQQATTTTPAASTGNTGNTGNTGSTGSTDTTTGTGASSGTDTGYMKIVNQWRTTMGRATFQQDSQLEANARKTAADGKGKMVHQLNKGSMGQVLAPGSPDTFEKAFVGGWLCERPDLPGLSQVCGQMSKGWNHAGQTGHADILSSKDYKKIGCANAGGIWACDVGK